jgi:phage portal protein BeeE
MRALADGYDLLRLVIETRKDQIEKMEWRIKVKENGQKASKQQREAAKSRIDKAMEFLQFPDREHTWATWLRMALEDMLVLDACTVYPRMTRGGDLYSLDLMAGETIVRKLNKDGRTPIPPDVAYQQYIKGVPMADYTRDDILYYPRNLRTNRAYGYSPVEQIIMTVNIAIRRQIFQLNYYTEGNVPEALIPVPDTWTSDQISQFQVWFDNLLEGDLAQRRKMKFVPAGLDKIQFTKEAILKDEYDEWLARVVCYAFSVPPTPFVKQVNRATAQTAQVAALQEGLVPIQNWIKNLHNIILWKYLQQPDLEFSWEEEVEMSAEEQAGIMDKKIRNGSMTIDESRDLDGKDPLPNGLGAQPLIFTAMGAQLLSTVLEPPEPVEPPPTGAAPEPASGSARPTDKNAAPPPKAEKLEKIKKKTMKPIDRERKKIKTARTNIKNVLTPLFRKTMKSAKEIFHVELDKAESDQVKKILAKLDLEGWAVITDDIDEILAAVTRDGTYQALYQIGMSEENLTDKMSELALKYAKDRAAELVGRKWVDGKLIDNPKAEWAITDSTREMLRSDVARAIEEGWSNKKFADAIEENYAFSEARAEMIARTETAFADVQGNMNAYKESGVVSGKEWIVGSGGGCDECEANDAQGEIGIDEDFSSGDDAPPLHPN